MQPPTRIPEVLPSGIPNLIKNVSWVNAVFSTMGNGRILGRSVSPKTEEPAWGSKGFMAYIKYYRIIR